MESNAPLESTQKKTVLRRHAEYILHPGGVDCGMFRQTGGPGGADSGAYLHVRATVGPRGSARGGVSISSKTTPDSRLLSS